MLILTCQSYQPEYPDEPRLYKYSYSVDDDYEGAVLNVNESSDEYETHGSYEVRLIICFDWCNSMVTVIFYTFQDQSLTFES